MKKIRMTRSPLMKKLKLKHHMKSKHLRPNKTNIPFIKMKQKDGHYSFVVSSLLLKRKLKIGGGLPYFALWQNVATDCAISS